MIESRTNSQCFLPAISDLSDGARYKLVFACVICFIAVSAAFAQSSLPPGVQAELLQLEIVAEVKAGDGPKALDSIDRYRDLKVPVPPPLLYAEAALAEAADPGRSLAAIEQYLTEAPASDPDRQSALILYTRVRPVVERDPDVQSAYRQRVERNRRLGAGNAGAGEPVAGSTPSSATVIFFRPKKFAGSGQILRVRDATGQLGQISSGKYFTITVPPGKHQFYMTTGLLSPDEDVLDLDVEPGATYYVKAWNAAAGLDGFKPHLELSSREMFERRER